MLWKVNVSSCLTLAWITAPRMMPLLCAVHALQASSTVWQQNVQGSCNGVDKCYVGAVRKGAAHLFTLFNQAVQTCINKVKKHLN